VRLRTFGFRKMLIICAVDEVLLASEQVSTQLVTVAACHVVGMTDAASGWVRGPVRDTSTNRAVMSCSTATQNFV